MFPIGAIVLVDTQIDIYLFDVMSFIAAVVDVRRSLNARRWWFECHDYFPDNYLITSSKLWLAVALRLAS